MQTHALDGVAVRSLMEGGEFAESNPIGAHVETYLSFLQDIPACMLSLDLPVLRGCFRP